MRTLYSFLVGTFFLGGAACGEEEEDAFGYVTMELIRGAATDENIFGPTDLVDVSLNYDSCLADYYLNEGNSWAFDGADGSPVFSEWEQRLCDQDLKRVPDCEVLKISQTLEDGPVAKIASLEVQYKINDSAIELALFYIGPIPVTATKCKPTVEMHGGSVLGKNGAGAVLWKVDTYDPSTSNPSILAPFEVTVKGS